MSKSTRFLNVFIVCLFLLGLPSGAFANSPKVQNNEKETEQLQERLNLATPKLKDKTSMNDFKNPNDYLLINPGKNIPTLTDSRDTKHTLTYESTTSYSTSEMLINILHKSSNDKTRDEYLTIEFFTNKNGTLHFVGYRDIDLSYYTGTNKVSTIIDKAVYKNDPYMYIRVGISESKYDKYYSDVSYFKVANPFYKNNTGSGASAKYYQLISNESTNGDASESTGTFAINNDAYASSKNLQEDAYRMDYVVPFDTKIYAHRTLKKNARAVQKLYKEGDTKSFYVYNIKTGYYSSRPATLLYSGTHSNIWVNNNEITADDAKKLGQEFDSKIFNAVVNNFGTPSDIDQNGKLDILCYDIQDGFSDYGGYVAGYFSPLDLYDDKYSNRSEVFYIDTYPLMGTGSKKDVTEAYSTLAHEFQHMVNFNQKVFVQGLEQMDVWMDEGLAMAAEQIYLGKALDHRISYYNEDSSITNGHSLLYWDEYGDVLANYSLSYLFMQYVKAQTGIGDRTFKEIINQPYNDYRAIEAIANKYISNNLTFGKLMTNYRAALVLKEKTGLYGFKGDPTFNDIKVKLYNGSSKNLRGGGAIVRELQSESDFSIPAYKGTDITYTLLQAQQQNVPPILKTPTVSEVGDSDTNVKGTADPNVTIMITKDGKTIGSANSTTTGNFSVSIAKQKAGTKLQVYATKGPSNSKVATVTVKDKTAPASPKVNSVSDMSTVVSGTTEPSAVTTVTVGSSIIGSGKADSKGSFSVPLKNKLKAGTKLVVYATDQAKNKSKGSTIIVTDKTAPAPPSVNTFGDNQTIITGKAENGSKITIKNGKTLLGTATTNNGKFSVKIKSKQKAGTTLTAYATDKAGNTSKGKTFKVADKTPPTTPTVGTVTSKSTKVTGKAEKGSTVYVYNGNKYIGKGTTSSKGNYTVHIKKQKKGSTLKIYAKDKAGNKSKTRSVKVR